MWVCRRPSPDRPPRHSSRPAIDQSINNVFTHLLVISSICLYLYGAFTLPDTDTETGTGTDTDKLAQKPMGMCQCLCAI